MTNKTQKNIKGNGAFYWLIMGIVSAFLFVVLWTIKLFPRVWLSYVAIALIIILVVMGLLSFKFSNNKTIKVINVILALMMLIVAIMTPIYNAKTEAIFEKMTLPPSTLNLYVKAEDSKASLKDYKDSTFLTSISHDKDSQTYALEEINKELGEIKTVDSDSTVESVDKFYKGEGDVLLMNRRYESFVKDFEEYGDFSDKTKLLGSYYREYDVFLKEVEEVVEIKDPFVVLFAGNDEEGEVYLDGRTDVNLVLVVNPATNQMLQVNIPRDSYIPNPALGGGKDKLTHLGMNGITNTMEGLGGYLGVDINNFIIVNFTTYREIIDSIGGVDVENPYAFTFWDNPDFHYPQGTIHMDGMQALLYVRERKTLPKGDFDRVMHQQLVMSAIINKVTSPAFFLKIYDFLDSLEGRILTNFTKDNLYDLASTEVGENKVWDIISYHISGGTGMEYCASFPSQPLSIVYPSETQIEFVKGEIQKILKGEVISQEELPGGY